jgi:hypothetical protein
LDIINPTFKLRDEEKNIFTFRRLDYEQILPMVREIVTPVTEIGFTINEITLKDSRISSSEYRRLKIQALPDAVDSMKDYVSKFFKDITGKIAPEIDPNIFSSKSKIAENIAELIDSVKYRADFIDRTERMRAYNYAKALGLRLQGFDKASISKETNCEICAEKNYEIELKNINVESVPPYRANSVAKIMNGIS